MIASHAPTVRDLYGRTFRHAQSQVLFSAIAAKTMTSKAWELYDRRALTR
jgi:hypothetical protein